jgi:protein-S-isoprenylcysteine O-methyltransferase Ste14
MRSLVCRWRSLEIRDTKAELTRFARGRHKACTTKGFGSMPEFVHLHLPVVATLLVFAERMREVFTKRQVVSGQTRERLTFNLFMTCGLLIVSGGIAEFYLRHHTLYWPTFVAGTILSIASFCLRRSAIRALGRFWSLHVEMREGHEFVRSGPFAYARHPVYLSMVLELLGIGLLLNAWFATIAVFALFVPTVIARIRIEEEALIAQFGEAYRQYMRQVPAIFPRRGGQKLLR